MLPTLKPGALLLGTSLINVKPGRIVVTRTETVSIKRVSRVSGSEVWLEGDNKSASTDSRHYGPIKRSDVGAVVIRRLY